MAKQNKYRLPKETDEQVVNRWLKGSAGPWCGLDRDAAFADIGNDLILNVGGVYYTRYFLPDAQPRYVVLEWDDSGNETVL